MTSESVFDVFAEDINHYDYKSVVEELNQLAYELKQTMNRGLTFDDMEKARPLLTAIETAGDVVSRLAS